MKTILLYDKTPVLVSDEDYDRVNAFSWVHVGRYAGRYEKDINGQVTVILLHRFILNATQGQRVSFKNAQDPLNNTRENLRFCVIPQNCYNRKKAKHSQWPYKGIQQLTPKERGSKRWRARITKDGQCFRLGYFSTPEEAAIAYNNAALKMFGEFAQLNNF